MAYLYSGACRIGCDDCDASSGTEGSIEVGDDGRVRKHLSAIFTRCAGVRSGITYRARKRGASCGRREAPGCAGLIAATCVASAASRVAFGAATNACTCWVPHRVLPCVLPCGREGGRVCGAGAGRPCTCSMACTRSMAGRPCTRSMAGSRPWRTTGLSASLMPPADAGHV